MQQLGEVAWIKEAGIRIRDQGNVFQVEAFMVRISERVTTEELNAATRAGLDLSWKIQPLVIIPVRELLPNLHEANTHAGRG